MTVRKNSQTDAVLWKDRQAAGLCRIETVRHWILRSIFLAVIL